VDVLGRGGGDWTGSDGGKICAWNSLLHLRHLLKEPSFRRG